MDVGLGLVMSKILWGCGGNLTFLRFQWGLLTKVVRHRCSFHWLCVAYHRPSHPCFRHVSPIGFFGIFEGCQIVPVRKKHAIRDNWIGKCISFCAC